MGILATELRIGNWYLSTKFQVPVICEMGDFYEIYARADGSTEYTVDDIFQSIPITEEWLLKFKLINGIFPDNEYFSVRLSDDWCSLYFENNYTAVDFRYVHQLQNLYFALTGEELKIN